jgi:hypothetical protein
MLAACTTLLTPGALGRGLGNPQEFPIKLQHLSTKDKRLQFRHPRPDLPPTYETEIQRGGASGLVICAEGCEPWRFTGFTARNCRKEHYLGIFLSFKLLSYDNRIVCLEIHWNGSQGSP